MRVAAEGAVESESQELILPLRALVVVRASQKPFLVAGGLGSAPPDHGSRSVLSVGDLVDAERLVIGALLDIEQLLAQKFWA